jgi:hypothetical protein
MAAPYGSILTDEDDFEAVRDALGLEPNEMPDDLIGEPWANQAGERFVMRRVQSWAAILQLGAPATPVPSVAALASILLPATYSVVLVAKATSSGPVSPPSAGANAVVTLASSQVIQLTPPPAPGIGAYDLYVGTTAGQEYLQQTNLTPGTLFTLGSYAVTGQGIQNVPGDGPALKAATISATAGMICRRLQRRQPEETRTLDYSERISVDWREEEAAHMEDCSFHLGLITVYQLTPTPAAMAAHPSADPTDPNYQSGTNPFAIPPAWPYRF